MSKEEITKKITKKPVVKKEAAKKTEPVVAKTDQPKKSNPDKFAVIKTGGKQYLVSEGKKYDFEKIEAEEGKTVEFNEVLLIANVGDVKIGQPLVSGAKVTGKVISQFRDDKIIVLKYKPKKRYRKTQGHRQSKTKVEITTIK